MTDDPVWYVAYASNMSSRRLRCYLEGGRPAGARRTYVGCRDPSPPAADVALVLPGSLAFAGRSRVWGGAIAFYDERGGHEVAARAFLLTFGQLSDLVAQEVRRPVGTDLLRPERARPYPAPSGTYESVVTLGHREGVPLLCLTSRQPLVPAPPSAAYLRTIADGLWEAYAWPPSRVAAYLLQARGVTPAWTEEQITDLVAADRRIDRSR